MTTPVLNTLDATPGTLDSRREPDGLGKLDIAVGFATGPMVKKALKAGRDYLAAVLQFNARQRGLSAAHLGTRKRAESPTVIIDPMINTPRTTLLSACIQKVLNEVRKGVWKVEKGEEKKDYDDLLDELKSWYLFPTDALKDAYEAMQAKATVLTELLEDERFMAELDNRTGQEGAVHYTTERKVRLARVLLTWLEACEVGKAFLVRSVGVPLDYQTKSPRLEDIPLFHPARFSEWQPAQTLSSFTFNHYDPAQGVLNRSRLGQIGSVEERRLYEYLEYCASVISVMAGSVPVDGEVSDAKPIQPKFLAQAVHKLVTIILPEADLPDLDLEFPKSFVEFYLAFQNLYPPADSRVLWMAYPPHIASAMIVVFAAVALVKTYAVYFDENSPEAGNTQQFLAEMKALTGFIKSLADVLTTTGMHQGLKEALGQHLKVLGLIGAMADMAGSYQTLSSVLEAGGDPEEAIAPHFAMAAASLGFYMAVTEALALAGIATASAITTGPGALVVGIVVLGLGITGHFISALTEPDPLERILGHSAYGRRTRDEARLKNPATPDFAFWSTLEGWNYDRQIGTFMSGFSGIKTVFFKERHEEGGLEQHALDVDVEFDMPVVPGQKLYFYPAKDHAREHTFREITLRGADAPSNRLVWGRTAPRFQVVEAWESKPSGERLAKLFLRLIVDDEDDLDQTYEIQLVTHNDYTTYLQRKLISEFTDVPEPFLIIDLPIKMYFRGKGENARS